MTRLQGAGVVVILAFMLIHTVYPLVSPFNVIVLVIALAIVGIALFDAVRRIP